MMEDNHNNSNGPQCGPVVHPIEEVPFCDQCRAEKKDEFDFECVGCVENLSTESITIGNLFAIARQWCPSVQANMDQLVGYCLEKGAHPDDRDELTDM